MHMRLTVVLLLLPLLLPAGPAVAQAPVQQPMIGLELNKMEDRDGGCRTYFVVDNATASSFESFKLDLVMFGTDSVIARRLAVEAAPFRAAKTAVKLFDLAGLPCAGIGQVLVNDVPGCRDENGEQADCLGRLSLASRTLVKLRK